MKSNLAYLLISTNLQAYYKGHIGHTNLLPVFLILNGIYSTARSSRQNEVKLGIFTEAAGVTQEWVLLVVIDGPG